MKGREFAILTRDIIRRKHRERFVRIQRLLQFHARGNGLLRIRAQHDRFLLQYCSGNVEQPPVIVKLEASIARETFQRESILVPAGSRIVMHVNPLARIPRPPAQLRQKSAPVELRVRGQLIIHNLSQRRAKYVESIRSSQTTPAGNGFIGSGSERLMKMVNCQPEICRRPSKSFMGSPVLTCQDLHPPKSQTVLRPNR
jgi:hypothetical protein